MIDLFEQIYTLTRAGESFAVATVVRVEKPISAKPGDKAIIKDDGALHGWVGGGCAQDVVVREAKKAIRDGAPRFLRLIGSGAAVSESPNGVLTFPITCHSGGTMDVYLEPVLPRPQLILLGSSPVAVTLARLAKVLNFEVDVLDPAATPEQFPDADWLSLELDLRALTVRPIAFAVVATQGHDDEVALEAATRSGAPYVAFVASRKKFASRVEYLRERGLSEEQIARIKAPAGLDLGAITPDEIAVSILAEMIGFRRRPPQSGPSGAMARPEAETDRAPASEAALAVEAQDVVCGMMVEIATARHIAEFQGRATYFCSASCQRRFEQNPARYLGSAPTPVI